ncbi:hypothetical protein [Thalassobium sp. R2A62]|nr:hypothetical protein [Thalassobium sp. R2A62]EET48357.1 hypothetical protein TR2A62_1466 [Thalassobium sp. R2A62]
MKLFAREPHVLGSRRSLFHLGPQNALYDNALRMMTPKLMHQYL